MPRTHDETRTLLLDAALTQFAANGFDGTSIRRIAEAAGVSLGLLYHYFPSKEAVLQALFDRSVTLIQDCFLEVAEVADPAARLDRLVRVSLRVMRDQRDFYRVSAAVRGQPQVLGALAPLIAGWNAALTAQCATLLEAAGIAEPGPRALLLIAALDGVCQQYAVAPDTYPLDAVGDTLVRCVLHPDPHPRGAP